MFVLLVVSTTNAVVSVSPSLLLPWHACSKKAAKSAANNSVIFFIIGALQLVKANPVPLFEK
jgi:hypothetical protein